MPELLMPLRTLVARVPGGYPRERAAAAPAAGDPFPDEPVHSEHPAALRRWIAAAGSAYEPCLVLDAQARVVSLSETAAEMLGRPAGDILGLPLLSALDLLDFETGARTPDYAERIPPVLALVTGGLVRSLLRVARDDGRRLTLDACAAAVHDTGGEVCGVVCFLAPIVPG